MFTVFNSNDPVKAEELCHRLSTAQDQQFTRRTRTALLFPKSVVVHATHNAKATLPASEGKYLMTSPDASAHVLIGRDDRVYTIVPFELQAWHAGRVYTGYRNSESLGVELHSSYIDGVGQPLIGHQRQLLIDLLGYWSHNYRIPQTLVKRHADVAVDKNGNLGRKKDPACLPRAAFDKLLQEVWWYDR